METAEEDLPNANGGGATGGNASRRSIHRIDACSCILIMTEEPNNWRREPTEWLELVFEIGAEVLRFVFELAFEALLSIFDGLA